MAKKLNPQYNKTVSKRSGRKVFTLKKVELAYIIGSHTSVGSNPLHTEKGGWSNLIEENLN